VSVPSSTVGEVWVTNGWFESSLTLHHLLKMEPTQSSETSAFNTRTPGKYPEDNLSLLQHGESLKTRKMQWCLSSALWLKCVTVSGLIGHKINWPLSHSNSTTIYLFLLLAKILLQYWKIYDLTKCGRLWVFNLK